MWTKKDDVEDKIELKICVDKREIDEILEKVERLHSLLKETNSLLEELVSKGLLKIDVQI